jgi:CheY-like chemotaxis protein
MQYDLADSLPRIDADATQMHQVVMNLTANATEAIGERRGVITIRTRVVRGDLLAQNCIGENPGEGNYVALEVSDTGVGMDEETQVSIFDPFFSTKYTGRGLGLSSVQGIVRRHKGAILVDSEEGRGTTFQLLFPSREEPSIIERKKEDAPSKETGKAPLLLLADDEEGVRYVVRKMLEKQGYRVITARDGKEAVELFAAQESEIDLVLLDMAMPRMNGEEAFQEMIKIRPELKVILCSGYNEQEATHRFRNGELAGFIQKPFQADQFLGRVRALLEEASPVAIRRADASP